MRLAIRLIAAFFIAGCAFFVVRHLRYISGQTQPTIAVFHQELAASEAALGATPLAPVEITDKGISVFATQAVRFAPPNTSPPTKKALASIGWRYVREDGVGSEFCKGNIVLTVSNEPNSHGFFQIVWGDADTICG